MRKILNPIIKYLGVELHKYVPVKTKIRHTVDTLACSLDDDTPPNDWLIELSSKTIRTAWRSKINATSTHPLNDAMFFDVFPGEHYRLLKALAKELNPKVVVEIGTYTGMGTFSLLQGLSEPGIVHTYDIIPWHQLPTHLSDEYFTSGKVTQHLANLAEPETFKQNLAILESADLIFCDGPKDGIFEYNFIASLTELNPKQSRLLMLDDIHFKNMIDLWRSIESPKLDMSSFGHWSGTGLVDISNGLKIKKT